MTLFATTLQALAPLFLLILLGYGLRQARVLHLAHIPILNGLVLTVTLPALVVHGLTTAPVLALTAARLPLALLGAEAAAMAAAYLIGRFLGLPAPTRGAMLLVSAFGNTGFVGYPMTLALIPSQFPAAIVTDQFGMNIALFLTAALVGVRMGGGGSEALQEREAVRRFLRSPLFLSLISGLILRLLPWPHSLTSLPAAIALGRTLEQGLSYLGQGTTPLVLLALGASLRPETTRAYLKPLAASCLIKLLICPLVMWLLCRAFGVTGDLRTVAVLEASMPTAVMASVLSGQQDLAGEYAVGAVFASTLLSAVTVPLLLSVLR